MLSIAERRVPVDHPVRLMAEESVAISLRELGQLDRARELLEEVLAERLEALPEDSLAVQKSRLALSSTLLLGRRPGEIARARRSRPCARSSARSRPSTTRSPVTRSYLAQLLRMQGDLVGARLTAERALAVLEKSLPDDHLLLQDARTVLGVLMLEMGDLHGARDRSRRRSSRRRRRPGRPTHPGPTGLSPGAGRDARGCRASSWPRAGSSNERWLRGSACCPQGIRRSPGCGSTWPAMELGLGEIGAAREILEPLERELARLPAHHPHRIGVAQTLSLVLLLQGELARARELESAAIAAMESIYSPGDPTLQGSRRNLIRVLGACGDEPARQRELGFLADGLEARIRAGPVARAARSARGGGLGRRRPRPPALGLLRAPGGERAPPRARSHSPSACGRSP